MLKSEKCGTFHVWFLVLSIQPTSATTVNLFTSQTWQIVRHTQANSCSSILTQRVANESKVSGFFFFDTFRFLTRFHLEVHWNVFPLTLCPISCLDSSERNVHSFHVVCLVEMNGQFNWIKILFPLKVNLHKFASKVLGPIRSGGAFDRKFRRQRALSSDVFVHLRPSVSSDQSGLKSKVVERLESCRLIGRAS